MQSARRTSSRSCASRSSEREAPAEPVPVQQDDDEEHLRNKEKKLRSNLKKARASKRKRDPKDQTDQERKEIRRRYKDLRARTIEKHNDLASLKGSAFEESLKDQDAIHKDVLHSSEAAFDSEQINLMAQISVEQARKLECSLMGVTVNQFVRALQRNFDSKSASGPVDGSDVEDEQRAVSIAWRELGNHPAIWISEVPVAGFMSGVMEEDLRLNQKQRKRHGRIDRSSGTATEASNLDHGSSVLAGEKDPRVATLLKIIQNQGKISLISLIMNPHSFTQSVENLFDLSFLIADGHVGIERTQDMIYIRARRVAESHEVETGDVVMIESIFSIDQELWKACVRAFDLVEPIVPTRF